MNFSPKPTVALIVYAGRAGSRAYQQPAKDGEEFQKFYNTQRISEAILFPDTPDGFLTLSVEAKLAIKNSLREIKKYHHNKVQPFHLFLAISEFDNSFLSEILSQKVSLYLTLIEHYKNAGHIFDEQKQSGIISKIKNSLRGFKLLQLFLL